VQHTATRCNTLQHTETHCNTRATHYTHYTATHYNTRHHAATRCNTLQHAVTHYPATHYTASHYTATYYPATHCNTLHRNTLQHAATHCTVCRTGASISKAAGEGKGDTHKHHIPEKKCWGDIKLKGWNRAGREEGGRGGFKFGDGVVGGRVSMESTVARKSLSCLPHSFMEMRGNSKE